MKRRSSLVAAATVCLVSLSGSAAFGQFGPRSRSSYSGYQRHSFSIGGGGGVPRGDLQPLLATSPAIRINYGYRFLKNFQADIGFDTVFHAAKIRDFYESNFGDLRIKDYQFFLPVGARTIVPLANNRVQFHAGGGGAWMTYRERIRQPFGDSNIRLDCPVCRTRSGFGYYALLGTSVALDRAQLFRLGFTTKLYRGRTSGDAFGPVPATRTQDQWLTTAAEFSVNF